MKLSQKTLLSAACMLMIPVAGFAQQARTYLDYNPQKNTENYPVMYGTDISPEVHADRTVTFRITAPQAQTILLTGDLIPRIEGAESSGVPFVKGGDGIWTLTVGPFEPNLYAYRFVIDGVAVTDPSNSVVGTANQPPFSIVVVAGDGPGFYDPQNVPHGSVTRHIYHSDVLNGEREMFVYTPPGYSSSRQYPALYLFGGSGELASTWSDFGRVNFIMDNLLAEKKALPMLIVMPNNQMVHRRNPDEGTLNPQMLNKELRNHIIPLVESNYSVIKTPQGRAIAGLSMGGRHTQDVGFNSLDLFASFGVLSAGAVDTEARSAEFLNDPYRNDKVRYLFVGQGTFEKAERTYALRDALIGHGVNYDYYEGGDSRHDFITWRHLMYYRFLPSLWR